ncbi:hypothetical protein N8456_02145 [Porticoccaceae bacterium]|nr:hypothetical protein [Porticoccaceae bacterium]
MTDTARAEITNGIWLCRNCHKIIDTDDNRYTVDLLFAWREKHEKFVLSELGNSSDRIQLEQQESLLSTYESYPSIVRRIVIDKPDGWEWRLAAELMRYFNDPHFRRIKDLQGGFYIKARNHIDEERILDWIGQRLNEASNIAAPVEKLLDRLTLSFGKPGESGDIHEIHHVCELIRDYIAEVIKYEETLYFSSVPENAEKALELLKNCMSSQVEKLESIPNALDEVVSLIDTEHEGTKENPKVIQKTITFELPEGWERKMGREVRRLGVSYSDDANSGCATMIVVVLVITLLVIIFQ